jgi:hypothetical protein
LFSVLLSLFFWGVPTTQMYRCTTRIIYAIYQQSASLYPLLPSILSAEGPRRTFWSGHDLLPVECSKCFLIGLSYLLREGVEICRHILCPPVFSSLVHINKMPQRVNSIPTQVFAKSRSGSFLCGYVYIHLACWCI